MHHTVTTRALALAVGLASLAGLGLATRADAQPPYEPGNPGNTSVTLPTTTATTPAPCSSGAAWLRQPRVVVHTTEYTGATPIDSVVAAITDADNQIAGTGATSAEVTGTTTTTSPFDYKASHGNTVPTIHVGFVSSIPPPPGKTGTVLAETTPFLTDNPCERHIAVVETGSKWDYGTPLSSGLPTVGQVMYYDAGRANGNGVNYFRISYLHELLHAFGLNHTATGYSFENYGERPWRRGDSANAVRLLADDAEHLRALYPSTGSVTDVDVLNTYYNPDDRNDALASTPANQRMLCAPSKGSANADKFDGGGKDSAGNSLDDGINTCGKDGTVAGSTDLCGGGSLRTKVALTNLSTEDADVTVRYWISADDQWDATDYLSPTVPATIHIGHTASNLLSNTWTIPTIPLGTGAGTVLHYHVIARVEATTTSGTTVHSWIPLRGLVTLNTATCASV